MTAADLPVRAEVFHYRDLDLDVRTRSLICSYDVGGRRFEERITLEQGSLDAPGVEAAASLVFLLAGVSYYKAFAPEVVDLGDIPVTDEVRALLHSHYVDGLGEFAHENDLDLRGIRFVGGDTATPSVPGRSPAAVQRPLIPFGGGLDSLVSVELATRTTPNAALFVVSQAGKPFAAIENAAAVTQLPVLRATRQLDPVILDPPDDFLKGHIPITGIISAIAVLAAVSTDRDAVVMSNEWSASSPTRQRDGQVVNHQHSKSLDFERSFRAAVASVVGHEPQYYSLLRPFSELWIAREFAELRQFHGTFRSCNRAFSIDPTKRLDRWCGQCDKCAFIDLILSPFLGQDELTKIFHGNEPLQDPSLLDTFRSLLGASSVDKPFECVGDEEECRAAVRLAAERPDRAGNDVLRALVPESPLAPGAIERLLAPMGEHFIPEPHASDLRLV